MATIPAEFSLHLNIYDKKALAKAAAARAVRDGAFPSISDYLSEHGEDDVSSHVRMLLDPGASPDGCEILDSHCEVYDQCAT